MTLKKKTGYRFRTWNNGRSSDHFRPNYSLSDQMFGKFVRAKIIRSIVKNIFMFVNMMVCFSWCIVCESRVLLARFLSGRGQTLLSKPIQLVYTQNWHITKNCAISWVWAWEHFGNPRLRRQDDSMVPMGFPIVGLLLISLH